MAIKLRVQQPTSVKLSVQEQNAVALHHINDVIGLASEPYEGEYTVNPDETVQTLPTNGKGMLDDVTVTAIPSDYVGSAVERRDSDDLVATGNLVNVPAGFYEENCGKEIGYGSVSVPSVNIEAHPVITTDNNGLVSVSVSESESVSPSVTNGYVTAEQGHAGTITFAGTASSQLSTQGATSVHPSTSSQTAAPSGVFTTGAITVEPMDLETVTKSYTPTTSAQSETITPSVGKDGIAQVDVTVSAMPTATWRGGSRIEPTISMAVDSTTGEVSASVNTSTAIMPLNGSGYADRMTTYGVTVANSNTLQLDTQAGSTITPTTSEQTAVPAGTYTLGDVKIGAFPTGYRGAATTSATWNSTKRFYTTTYGSATDGYYPGSQWNNIPAVEMTRVWETVTPTESTQEITPQNSYHFIDKVTVNPIPSQYIVPSGTASITANGTGIDVAQYATADVNVKPILTFGTIRPDAELVKKVTYDKYIVADEEVTLPGYTTTSTVLKASQDLTDDTVTLSYASYNYYILERMLSIPTYSVSTVGKGRCEYNINSYLYEVGEISANSFITLDGSAKKYTSRTVSLTGYGMYREFYWSSGTAVTAYSTTAYGNFFTVTAPAINSGVLTLKTPVLGTRGHTTYYTSTYMNATTDIRYQWVIEVYRVPKNNLNLDGFGQTTHIEHILDCVNSDPTHKLV